ncbi:MAG: apolipoprotein N-acyltransferase [Phycisphaerales bacterium]|nr:apolipoprotein N-acyltransferase [Phycisphaerales bacterium]
MLKQKNRSAVLGACFAGLMSSIFLIFAFPPFSMWGFSFLIPIPYFIVVRSTKLSPSRAAFWSSLGALPGWIWTHLWVNEISTAGIIPLIIQLGIFSFLFVWIASHFHRKYQRPALILPLVWVSVEFFRGVILWGGYPWYLISHPLIESPLSLLAMPASWFGVYFVSYLTATYSIILLLAITTRNPKHRVRIGLAAGGIFTFWIILGFIASPSSQSESRTIRVASIQPNIPQDNRMDWTVRQRLLDWLTLRDLTIAAILDPKNPEPVDVIVWPEGFVPGWTFDPVSLETERSERLAWSLNPRSTQDAPDLQGFPSKIEATMVVDELLMMQAFHGIPMLVGSVAFDNLQIVDTDEGVEYQRDAMYNSAFLVVDGQPQPVWYDKLHLTPFGEIMPYISHWEWLEKQMLSFAAQGMEFALSGGNEIRRLELPVIRDGVKDHVSIATPICFEATISSVCRKLVSQRGKRKADILVNITNDGWFGSWDPGREAHLQNARWRSIELHTPMVRSANTGISCIIDRRGQVTDRSITATDDSDPNQGYLIGDVVLGSNLTFYSRIGDVFGWVCFLTAFSMGISMIFTRSSSVEQMSN